MTRDDFKDSAKTTDKAGTTEKTGTTAAVVSFRPPAPRAPAPRPSFAMPLMPVVAAIKVLPPALKEAAPAKQTTDEE